MSPHRARHAALPVAAALLLSAGPAEADAARARKALDDRYIPFTPKEFVARADRNQAETVALFLEAGMAVGAANEAGRTALHGGAARSHDGKLLALLLKAGALVNARTKAQQDVVEVIPRLLEKGADPRVRDRLGDTPLETARRYYRVRAEDLLRGAAPR